MRNEAYVDVEIQWVKTVGRKDISVILILLTSLPMRLVFVYSKVNKKNLYLLIKK